MTSTTPETDPTNTNTYNKGVIEGNTDVDVFAFTTGSGTVNLTVRPWIMPTGSRTRGGNLDVVAELYNEQGVLLLTNNTATTTSALIYTNLTEGVYYLRIRNTGTGSPLAASPSGFTAYGSIGQYFINGTVQPSGIIIAPQAVAQLADITQPLLGPAQLTVTYSDNVAIDASTLSDGDVRVTGPAGYDRAARLVSVDIPGNGTPRTATYAFDPPDSISWKTSDNGTYQVWMQTNQVADTEGAWVAGGQMGQFSVMIATAIYSQHFDGNPNWTFGGQWEYGAPAYPGAGPKVAFTGTNIVGYNLHGNYSNKLATVYATTPAFDCSGASNLTLKFYRWLGLKSGDTALLQVSTNGTSWVNVWTTTSTVADTGWQQVQYPLPAWVNNCPSVRLRWGIGSNNTQNDIGWNIDDVEVMGGFAANVLLNVSVTPAGWGTVNPQGGTFATGTSVTLQASPATYYAFKQWSGGISSAANPVTITLGSNLAITAEFQEIFTTNHPTPYWWLAASGYTNDFESAVTNTGLNGMLLWESYIAGLTPTNPASQLRLSISQDEAAAMWSLNWQTAAGRLYTIYSATNPAQPFTPLTGAADLPATVTNVIQPLGTNSVPGFYRLGVRKP